ncbi:hypothetical protein AVEN_172512-1 [Araneus ventricosus]|uniref:Uncharacterized protein n=1 Tax=Araneus ventricosus TaxID=182803 RepID=A0A4Y2DQF5_ARAVE|nr:hypothetical protein AVEN_172512-1 [Araneus ventricosus]
MRSDDNVNVMYRENFPRFSQSACAQRFFNSEKAMQGNKIRRQIAFAELRSATSSVGSRPCLNSLDRRLEFVLINFFSCQFARNKSRSTNSLVYQHNKRLFSS